MTLEICIDSFEGAKLAQEFGALRVELCSALSLGGITPSLSLVRQCTSLSGIEVHAMLRCREGNFVYTDEELELIREDMIELSDNGAKGVVFGCLTPDFQVDLPKTRVLVNQAKELGLECTFHRAFDFTTKPEESLKHLVDLGIDRLLSSGLKPNAIEGIDMLRNLVELSKGNIEIMAGSGVNETNALTLAGTGIDALHFTSHKAESNTSELGMGSKSIPDRQKIAAITALFQ